MLLYSFAPKKKKKFVGCSNLEGQINYFFNVLLAFKEKSFSMRKSNTPIDIIMKMKGIPSVLKINLS